MSLDMEQFEILEEIPRQYSWVLYYLQDPTWAEWYEASLA
jgi:preprotein translocase subunit Sss1